jgi:beta propeller repeat protein
LSIALLPLPLECAQAPHATPPGIQFVWPRQGLPICTAPGDQREPDINESHIVVWEDFRSGERDIYAQSIWWTGTLGWSNYWPQGTPVCTAAGSQLSPVITSDYAGGAVIAWIDTRNGQSGDVYAQRVLSSGFIAPNRPTDGIAVSVGGGPKVGARIAGDEAGGGYIAWMDGRNQALGQHMAVYIQRMMNDGTLADYWPANGMRVSTSSSNQANVAIIPDAANGAILAWEVWQPGTGSDIYAARFTPSGTLAPGWPDSGLAVCAAPGNQTSPTMISDGAGGALVAWMDYRGGDEPKIYVQHVTASEGVAVGWDPNGIAVSDSPGSQSAPVVVSDGSGGALIALWGYFPLSGSSVALAQSITSAGLIATGWPSVGLALGRATHGKVYPRIVSDGGGGAIVAWNDSSVTEGSQVMAQHVTKSGAIAPGWGGSGVSLTRTPDPKFATGIASDGAGGAVVTWMDRRNGADWDVYAQEVTAGGLVGPDYCLRCGDLQTVSPNPGRGRISIQVLYPRPSSFVGVYDARGTLLRSVPLTGYAPTHVEVDISDLPSGVYFFGYPNGNGAARFAKAVLVR